MKITTHQVLNTFTKKFQYNNMQCNNEL